MEYKPTVSQTAIAKISCLGDQICHCSNEGSTTAVLVDQRIGWCGLDDFRLPASKRSINFILDLINHTSLGQLKGQMTKICKKWSNFRSKKTTAPPFEFPFSKTVLTKRKVTGSVEIKILFGRSRLRLEVKL